MRSSAVFVLLALTLVGCASLTGLAAFSKDDCAEGCGGDAASQADGAVADDATQDATDDTTAQADANGPDTSASDAPEDSPIIVVGEAGDAAAFDAGPPVDAACTPLIVHANGLGQNFSDCTALGTHDVRQAVEACTAFTGNAGLCTTGYFCGSDNLVCTPAFTSCACWDYSGNKAAGHVKNAATCTCAASSDPTWN